jgi:hypothetical protein
LCIINSIWYCIDVFCIAINQSSTLHQHSGFFDVPHTAAAVAAPSYAIVM